MSTSNEELHGLADITKYTFSFVDSMVLKCAVELRIADIIHSHGKALTLSQIASKIDSPNVNLGNLKRVMRMLVRMKIFTTEKHESSDEDELVVYGLTPFASMLVHDVDITLAPFVLMENYPALASPWHYLSDVVKEGGSGFKRANGVELFEMARNDQELNKVFNNAMRCITKIFFKGMFSTSNRDVFKGVHIVVDVGGGMGQFIGEIVKEFPNIKGFNLDLAHVVKMAPEIQGVTHVAGDMFKEVPNADVVTLKNILLDWGDEDCVKILKNCRNAIKENGKVIIVGEILKEDEEGNEGYFGNIDVIQDLTMMVHTVGGKQRTEIEWKKILEEAGFSRYNKIELNYFSSLIQAYPK